MTLALLVIPLVLVVLGAFWLIDRKDERQRVERAALINHIQFGERLPTRSPVAAPQPASGEPEPDEFDLVGTIQSPRKTA